MDNSYRCQSSHLCAEPDPSLGQGCARFLIIMSNGTATAPYLLSWCPGRSVCDPCLWSNASEWIDWSHSDLEGYPTHLQYNFGQNFFPVAVPVFESCAYQVGPYGTVTLELGVPFNFPMGTIIGTPSTPNSYNVTTTHLSIQLMGISIYETDVAAIRNYFISDPFNLQTQQITDGYNTSYRPNDVIPIPMNYLSSPIYRADNIAGPNAAPIPRTELEPNVLYITRFPGSELSFYIGTKLDGTPDLSTALMSGFVYAGPGPTAQELITENVIIDAYINTIATVSSNSSFPQGGIQNVLWFKGPPNPSA
jgi:hypothetical protein